MSIQVKFFASLREQLNRAGVDLKVELNPEQAATVAEVWHISSGDQPMPANLLCAVNMEYVDMDHAVVDGDEVAFFPPVTGG